MKFYLAIIFGIANLSLLGQRTQSWYQPMTMNQNISESDISKAFQNPDIIFVFFVNKNDVLTDVKQVIEQEFLRHEESKVRFLVYSYEEDAGKHKFLDKLLTENTYLVYCPNRLLLDLFGEYGEIYISNQNMRKLSLENCVKNGVGKLGVIQPKIDGIMKIYRENKLALELYRRVSAIQENIGLIKHQQDSINDANKHVIAKPLEVPKGHLHVKIAYSFGGGGKVVQPNSLTTTEIEKRNGRSLEIGYKNILTGGVLPNRGIGFGFSWFNNDLIITADSSFKEFEASDTDGNLYKRRVYGDQIAEHVSITGVSVPLSYYLDIPLSDAWKFQIESGVSFYYLRTAQFRVTRGDISTRGWYDEANLLLTDIPEYGLVESEPINRAVHEIDLSTAGAAWFVSLSIRTEFAGRLGFIGGLGILTSPKLFRSTKTEGNNEEDYSGLVYSIPNWRLNLLNLSIGLTYRL